MVAVGVARLSIWRASPRSHRFTLALLLTGIGFLLPAIGFDFGQNGDGESFWAKLVYTLVAVMACELYGWVLLDGAAAEITEGDYDGHKRWFRPAVWAWRSLIAMTAVALMIPNAPLLGTLALAVVITVVAGLGVAALVRVLRGARASTKFAAAALPGAVGVILLGFVVVAVWGSRSDPDWLAHHEALVQTIVTAPAAIALAIAGLLGLWVALRDRIAARREASQRS
ncbi:hypothetical protein [Nocardia thailandica]|uniref:hypothetical protein n=1 Tax=Nocardia thailandica TaxID=257275 RepID=UPI0002D54F9C|nr:hypothetical protein [Nocardia thailandica]